MNQNSVQGLEKKKHGTQGVTDGTGFMWLGTKQKQILPLLFGLMSLVGICKIAPAQSDQSNAKELMDHNPRLSDFQVVEFRRYTLKEGQRNTFTKYFDMYFPEAFQQLGTIVAGSFAERQDKSGFVWIRGFHTLDDRATLNGAFYFGSVWNEHRKTMSDLIVDADDVLLLRPLSREKGLLILPAVDPVTEANGTLGVVVAQIFAIKPNQVEDFAKQAETVFAGYRAAGAREAGVLVTLDAENNYPQLAFRTDGPFLVWLGIIKDSQALDAHFAPVAEHSLAIFNTTELLRGAPELIVLDPTPRSRLRWMP